MSDFVPFRLKIFITLLLFLFLIPFAFAGMSLSQAIIHFEENGERSRDIIVFNQGEETLYIRVEPVRVYHPGSKQEKREKYHNPREAGLLVSPQRLVIAPGGRKRLRFVRLDQTKTDSTEIEQDRVFRVLVKPEVGELKSSKTAVKIVVAYEVLVLSQPKNASIDLTAKLVGKQLHFTNKGNTNVLLLEGHQCPKNQSIEDKVNQCVKLTGKRIYAGNEWQVEIPYLTPVTYQISKGLENSTKSFELVK